MTWVPKIIEFNQNNLYKKFNKQINSLLSNLSVNLNIESDEKSQDLLKASTDPWVVLELETRKLLNECLITQKQHKNTNSDFNCIKSDIDISIPKIHQQLMVQAHLHNFNNPNPIAMTVELKNAILDTVFEEHKKLVHMKWGQDLKQDSLDKMFDAIRLTFNSTYYIFFPTYFLRMCQLADEYFKLLSDRILEFKHASSDSHGDGFICLYRNWTLKIYSNTDLITRIFCSIAMQKITNKYEKGLYDVVEHLYTLRGVSNAFYAIYLRVYFIQINKELYPNHLDAIVSYCLSDVETILSESNWLEIYKQDEDNVDIPTCFNLLAPALKYIAYHAMRNGSPKASMIYYIDRFSKIKVPILLESVIHCIDPNVLIEKIDDIIKTVYDFHNRQLSTFDLVKSIGECLSRLEVAPDIKIIERFWVIIQQYTNAKEYISCASVWIEYAMQFRDIKRVKAFLSDIFCFFNSDIHIYTFNSPDIYQLLKKIIKKSHFDQLVPNVDLLTCLANINESHLTIDCCIEIFKILINSNINPILDPIQIAQIQKIFQLCNDKYEYSSTTSINSSIDNPFDEIQSYFCTIISRISFGTDLKKAVKRLSEFRAAIFCFTDTYYIIFKILTEFFLQNDKFMTNEAESDDIILALTLPLISLPSLLPSLNAVKFCLVFARFAQKYSQIRIGYLFLDLILITFPNIVTKSSIEVKEFTSTCLMLLEVLALYPKHPIKSKFHYFVELFELFQHSTHSELNEAWKLQITAKILYHVALNITIHKLTQSVDNNDEDGLSKNDLASCEIFLTYINKLISNSQIDEKSKDRVLKLIQEVSDNSEEPCKNFIESLNNIRI